MGSPGTTDAITSCALTPAASSCYFEQDERAIAVLTGDGEGVFEVAPIVALATTTAAARRNHEPMTSQTPSGEPPSR